MDSWISKYRVLNFSQSLMKKESSEDVETKLLAVDYQDYLLLEKDNATGTSGVLGREGSHGRWLTLLL